MILVLPFCNKDGPLAIQNLEWIAELDAHQPYMVLLSYDDQTPPSIVQRMGQLAKATFEDWAEMWYPAPQKLYWPAAANWAFQNAARYVAHFYPTESWLFLEADATPIRRGWLADLEAEHVRGGKPFSGHVVSKMGHPNGVAIYPPMVAMYSMQAMQVEETAWDVVIGATVDPDLIHNIGKGEYKGEPKCHLMQHCWNMDHETGEPTNGHGYSPTFKDVHDMVRKVDLTACLYHRCKDGSLIRCLREFYKNPTAAMVPQHTRHEEAIGPGLEADQQGDGGDRPAVRDPGDHPRSAYEGRCEILIVTYAKDEPWLRWAMRAIRHHCTGFTGVTLAIPDRDAGAFRELADEHAKADKGLPLRIRMFKERPGKGMLTHMAVMGSADQFVPAGTDHVLHLDADCIFREPTTPGDYIQDNKPDYVWRTYTSLAEVRDGQKVVSDCVQWKMPTEVQLGFETDVYTMCRHPSVFPIAFYGAYRTYLEGLHGEKYLDYMIAGRNTFPQTRMDFTAMGAWAFQHMHDAFNWIDITGGNHLAPRDRQKTYWSHGGITPEIQGEMEGFLK